MSAFEIEKFTAYSRIPRLTATEVSDLFASNFPESHSEEDRIARTAEKINAEAIARSVAHGNTYYVGHPAGEQPIAGFLQATTRLDSELGTLEMIKWLMVDREYRGKRLASLLHRAFVTDAAARVSPLHPSWTMLSVHNQNPAVHIYEGWGYEPYKIRNDDDFIEMIRPLPSSEHA